MLRNLIFKSHKLLYVRRPKVSLFFLPTNVVGKTVFVERFRFLRYQSKLEII